MKIKTGSDFSGVGAFDQALELLGITQDKKYACDMDKFARQTYCLNYGTPSDVELSKTKRHNDICDALLKHAMKGTDPPESLVNDADLLAREFSFYFPVDVYLRNIPEEPLDIYMTSPPCQAFSMAGKRKGKKDRRGILFFNSLEFIEKNKPRFFIFENVKGLLSHDKPENSGQEYGRTFNEWVNYLGGKSVNGREVIFPYDDSVPYHIFHRVLNAKEHGVPQNRERVFIIGVRDDNDSHFHWPKTHRLEKRIKDVLESEVDPKYFLSQKMIDGFIKHAERHTENGNGFAFKPCDLEKEARASTTNAGSRNTDNYIKIGHINQNTQASAVYDENGVSPTLCSGPHGYANGYVATDEPRASRIVGRNPENPKSRKPNGKGGTEQMVEVNENPNVTNTLTTVEKDNVLILPKQRIGDKTQIRRLTPRECFRLMGFPDTFKWECSDSQAYKQAGNSIVVNVLAEIIRKLKLNEV